MWNDTPLTRRLGLDFPLIQAGMAGGITTPALVAAVSKAGGLGTLGVGYMPADQIAEAAREVSRLTARPFGINLFLPEAAEASPEAIARMQTLLAPYRAELGLPEPPPPARTAEPFEAQLEATLASEARVVSFTFGVPSPALVERLHAAAKVVIGTATTTREGEVLAEAGVDMIVAQGAEAGGHRGAFLVPGEEAPVGLFALLPQLVDRVSVPVIAAGGLMDGRGVAAALALGAVGAQLGSAFLACEESGAHPLHQQAILTCPDDGTRLTRAFTGKAARGVANRFMREMAAHEQALLPYPLQHVLTRDIRQAAARQGKPEMMALWAGQAARMARRLPAAEIVRSVAAETASALRRIGPT